MLDLGKTALPSVATDVPELCHLKVAAQRIGDVNYNLVAFHHRFFGPKPEKGEITAKP